MVDRLPAGSRAGKRPTIHEVARLAGVSHQTVSRFLREDPTMRPETSRRVAQAVAELGYRPNLAARTMRTRRSNRIAAILPGLTGRVPTRVLSGAAAAAHEAGYLLDVVSLEGDATARAARLEALLQPESTDGILSFTSLGDSFGGLALADFPVPIIVDGAYDDNMRSLGLFAEGSMAADMLRHLAELGHRRFVHVAGHPQWPSARDRRAVYEATIAELGLESLAVVGGDWSAKSGWHAATEVIAGSGATAVFAASDHVAYGVITGLQSAGVRVPQDVSVFGWDDLELSRFFRPSLTTIAVDRERQGREAVRRLLALLRGEPAIGPRDIENFNRIVLRDSTAPPARPGGAGRRAPHRSRSRRPLAER
ncbi:LacI family DNA-binding transcriptional regulator [Streptomyces sp. MP131-18]|uniref:LacI family DNA-binding transcriptional regulator n=1 Tax=Streptomyces sp. MP131-18 TaxID=1857892 RepID=UPI0009A17157|nr:LacI family DNA-binding transcriptional regulator [Streptomyces sp. MP131-18]ONK15981.1 Glucose-resistance amylase regulator [Streptomyces sp. MP131-18]